MLANGLDQNGFGWPSQNRLAEESGYSVETVRRALRQLEADGLLSRSDRRRPNGSFTSDAIQLAMPLEPAVILTVGQNDRRQTVVGEKRAKTTTSHQRSNRPSVKMTGPERDSTSKEETPHTPSTGSLRSPVENLSLVENAKTLTEALWALWPSVARKRHTKAQVLDQAVRQLKEGATAEQILAAARAHVAERAARGPEFVKGLALWLRGGLWRNWLPDEAPPAGAPDYADLERRWRDGGLIWDEDEWGPMPGRPGYRGQATDLFGGRA